IALTVQIGQRAATAVANQLDDRAIEDLVGRAIAMARLAPENAEQEPPLGRPAHGHAPNPADATTAKPTPEVRAKAVRAAIEAADAAKVSIAGFVRHGSDSLW